MPTAGTHTLRDVRAAGEAHVRIICGQCAREGRYCVAGLLQAHDDLALHDLLALLTEGCPKRIAGKAFFRCVAVYNQREELRVRGRHDSESV